MSMNLKIRKLAETDMFVRNLINKSKMLSLNVRTTTDCNMRCSYCYQNKNKSYITEKHLPSIEKFLKKVYEDRAKDNNDNYYSKLTLIGGEISLNPINIELVKIMEKLDIKEAIYFDVASNLYELNDTFYELMKAIDKYNQTHTDSYTSIQTSIDFSEERTNKNRRSKDGGNTYQRVMNNAMKLKKLGYEIKLNSVLTQQDIETLEPSWVWNQALYHGKLIGYQKISPDYYLSVKPMTEAHKKFMDKLYEYDTNYLIECLETCQENQVEFHMLKLTCISYMLLYVYRRYCIIGYNHTIEAVDEENIVVANCSNFTYNENEPFNKALEEFNEKYPDQPDYTKAVEQQLSMFECENCELKQFCRQVCYRINPYGKCSEFNRYNAEKMKQSLIKIISMDNFYEKFTNYLEKFGEKGEYNSWKKNPEFWSGRIKLILSLPEYQLVKEEDNL